MLVQTQTSVRAFSDLNILYKIEKILLSFDGVLNRTVHTAALNFDMILGYFKI